MTYLKCNSFMLNSFIVKFYVKSLQRLDDLSQNGRLHSTSKTMCLEFHVFKMLDKHYNKLY